MPHFQTRILSDPTDIELNRLLDLYESAGWWPPTRPDDLATLSKMIHNSVFMWVLESESTGIIGMARVLGDGISDVYIQDVTILPEFRRQGLATQLILAITDSLTQMDIDFIGLIAEHNTEEFYRHCGFDVIENAYPMRLQKRNVS